MTTTESSSHLAADSAASFPAFSAAKANFVKLRDIALSHKAEIARIEACIADTNAQAQEAKASRQALIRTGNTTTKALQELVTQERAAFSLIEDYTLVLQERREVWEDAKEEAEDAAKVILNARNSVIDEIGQKKLNEAIEACTPLFESIGYRVTYRINDDGPARFSQASQLGYEGAEDRALQEALSQIKKHYLANRDQYTRSELYSDLTVPSGLKEFSPHGILPAKRVQRRTLREQRERATVQA